jgi:HEAT repeat protein
MLGISKRKIENPGGRSAADWYISLRNEFHSFAGEPAHEARAALAEAKVDSVPLSILICGDAREIVRVLAIVAAAIDKREDCVESMISGLNDESETVRRSAACGLVMIRAVRGLAAVVSGNRHGHGIRTRAAYILQDIGPSAEEAIPGLMALLNYSDINWRSHMAASLALAAIGTPAIPYLVHSLEFGPDHARIQAASVLEELGLAPDRREQIERVLKPNADPSRPSAHKRMENNG